MRSLEIVALPITNVWVLLCHDVGGLREFLRIHTAWVSVSIDAITVIVEIVVHHSIVLRWLRLLLLLNLHLHLVLVLKAVLLLLNILGIRERVQACA